MNPMRAKEIAASHDMVNVTHHGVPIYIEHVAGDNQSAYVHPLHQPNNRKKVNLSSLIEQ